MQAPASRPVPEELRRAIIALNHPLLRTAPVSERHQVGLPAGRGGAASVEHRITAFLASASDIVFAANRTLHPGKKRLLEHVAAPGDGGPDGLLPHIRALLEGDAPLPAMAPICDDIAAMLRDHGLTLADGVRGEEAWRPDHTRNAGLAWPERR